MTLPPLIERELRTTLRKRNLRKNRLFAAGGAAALTLMCMWMSGFRTTQQLGPLLFRSLFYIACFASVLFTISAAGDLFTSERRNKTLGLLFLSGLSAPEIFFSKFGSLLISGISLQLAVVPFFALPALVGGVPPGLFAPTIGFLLNALVLTVAICTLASLLSTDDGTAIGIVVAIALSICGIPFAVDAATRSFGGSATSSGWLIFSPVYGGLLIFDFTAVTQSRGFMVNNGITFGYSILALTAAGLVLRRVWKDEVRPQPARTLRSRAISLLDAISGGRRIRSDWLDQNPFIWLAACDRRPVALAWLTLAGCAGIWLLCLAAWNTAWISVLNSLMTMILLNSGIAWILTYAAGKRIAEERRNRTLELLLTTPLTVKSIIAGQKDGIRIQFRSLFYALAALNAGLFAAGLASREWIWEAVLVYSMIWFSVLLFGRISWNSIFGSVVWIGLNSGRPAYAAFRALNPLSFIFFCWVMMRPGRHASWFAGFPYGTEGELLVVASILGVLIVIAIALANFGSKEKLLLDHFRSVAAEPAPEPSDPRFKRWNIEKPFPTARL